MLPAGPPTLGTPCLVDTPAHCYLGLKTTGLPDQRQQEDELGVRSPHFGLDLALPRTPCVIHVSPYTAQPQFLSVCEKGLDVWSLNNPSSFDSLILDF